MNPTNSPPLLKKASTSLTLLAFQLIRDADRSQQENEELAKKWQDEVKNLIGEFGKFGQGQQQGFLTDHDFTILDLIIFWESQQANGSIGPQQIKELTLNGQLFGSDISNIGQTLVLLTEPENTSSANLSLARECLKGLDIPFVDNNNPDRVYLSEGRLFNSPIFEYQGNDSKDSYHHIWLWFDSAKETKELIKNRYNEIKKMLCYRSKILHSFEQAKASSTRADNLYLDIKSKSNLVTQNISKDINKQQELDDLKQLLKDISKIGFALFEEIRYLKYYYNTIESNAHNYKIELEIIAKDKQPQDDFNFLYHFYHRSQEQFLKQINSDLSYITTSYDLANQTIAVIRGYIEIEQAKIAQEEADRNQQIQDTIEAIGVGIGAAAIIASHTGVMMQPWRFPWSKDSSGYPHPFLSGVLVSALCAVLFYWLVIRYKKSQR